jgi:hypothetical protein
MSAHLAQTAEVNQAGRLRLSAMPGSTQENPGKRLVACHNPLRGKNDIGKEAGKVVNRKHIPYQENEKWKASPLADQNRSVLSSPQDSKKTKNPPQAAGFGVCPTWLPRKPTWTC